MTNRFPDGALRPVLLLAVSLSPLGAADGALDSLVKRYTEKQTAPASIQTTAQPAVVPVTSSPIPTKPGERKPSPPLASLPAPKAAGPLRILLVDDDASSNNAGGDTGAVQRSDEIYRALVSKAVGERADAWSVEVVKNRENGPTFDRLRGFNVVLWYTGASYGSNNDTIGREDEKHLRRYLAETGGAVILVSPGYVNNLVYGQSWEAAEHPFLKEVLAVNGCYGMVERGVRGTVRAHHGTEFQVERSGATETLFSVVHPDGAAIVFTSPLTTSYAKRDGGLPVAVAHAYGQGRIVYVGFTFENIPERERAKAFETLLDAATGAGTPPVASAPPLPVAVTVAPPVQTYTPPPPAETFPKLINRGVSILKHAKLTIHTGNDGKESAAVVHFKLSLNGGRVLASQWVRKDMPLLKNTTHVLMLNLYDDLPADVLALTQQYGLRLDVSYTPAFFLDAWKFERIDLEIDFQHKEEWLEQRKTAAGVPYGTFTRTVVKSDVGFPRVISFKRGALLNGTNKTHTETTDRFFFPQ